MKRDTAAQQRVDAVNQRMARDWRNWGLMPLAACAILVLAITHGAGPNPEANDEILQRSFQAVLAVSAILFLVAFWLDGRWTNAENLAKRIWLAAGGDRFTPTSTQLAAQDALAFANTLNSVKTLTFTGCAIGIAAVIGSLFGLGFAHGLQLLLMAVSYQLFVLSRHPYYSEILQLAASGELVVTAPEPEKRK
jgi:hypothetical protein